MRNILSLLLLCLLGLALAGCGGQDRAALGKVTGTVSYQGQPIPAGTIIFEVPGARAAYGKIVDGRITEVTTYKPDDGAPVGTARIAVFASAAPAGDGSAVTPGDPGTATRMDANYMGAAPSLIPDKFSNPETSGLVQEISRGENTITLDITD